MWPPLPCKPTYSKIHKGRLPQRGGPSIGRLGSFVNKTLLGKRALMCAASFLFWFSQYIYNPFLSPYLLGLGISATFAGTIIGAYGFTQLVARFPLGISADCLQKHRIFILLGMLFSGLASVIRFFFPQPVPMLLANLLSGIASSMWISFTILFSRYYPPEELSKSIGLLTAMNNAGTLAAYLLGGALYEPFGMKSLFLGSALSGGLGLVIALFVKDEPPQGDRPQPRALVRSTLRDKRLWLFSIAALLYHMILFATANSFTSNIVKELGASGVEISACSALFMAASMIAAWFVGTKPAQTLGERPMMCVCFCLLGLYALVLPRLDSLPLIMIMQFLGGLGGSSLISLLMSNAVRNIPGVARSTGMGFFQSVYALGIMLGPVWMGAMADRIGFVAGYAIVGVLSLACAAGLYLLTRKEA